MLPEEPKEYEYGVGSDTASEEEEAIVDEVDDADDGPSEVADFAEPLVYGLVCRNNVNTLIVRQKSYPWFSA